MRVNLKKIKWNEKELLKISKLLVSTPKIVNCNFVPMKEHKLKVWECT